MPETDPSAEMPDTFKDAAARSQEAGIADETAAFDGAAADGASPSIDDGDPATTDDGSGTSERD